MAAHGFQNDPCNAAEPDLMDAREAVADTFGGFLRV